MWLLSDGVSRILGGGLAGGPRSLVEKGWKYQYSESEALLPVPQAGTCWSAADALAIFQFHVDDEVDFDVDRRELQGQDRLHLSCVLQEIGERLGKRVLMGAEGDHSHPVLGFESRLIEPSPRRPEGPVTAAIGFST